MATVAVRSRVKDLSREKEGEYLVPSSTVAQNFPGYEIHRLLDGVNSNFLCQINRIGPGKFKCHAHDGENFLVILEGEGEYFIDEKKTVPVKAGDFCHAMPFEPHGIRCTGTKPIMYLAIEGIGVPKQRS